MICNAPPLVTAAAREIASTKLTTEQVLRATKAKALFAKGDRKAALAILFTGVSVGSKTTGEE